MRKRVAAAFAVVIAMSATARADDEEDKKGESSDEADDKPTDKARKAGKSADDAEPAVETEGTRSGRMTLPGGALYVNAVVETNLAKGAAGKPLSLAPDIWYGAGDKLTLGLVHSSRGSTGFLTGFVNGLCFLGGDGGGACAGGLAKIYTTVGAEARIAVSEGGFALALPIGLYASAFNPSVVLSAKIGLIGRWESGPLAIELQPTLFAGLTQRASNNEERFGLPVTLFYKVSPAFAVAAQTGIALVVEHAKDTYQVPAALGVAWWVTPKLSVDVAFGLAAVVDANSMTKPFDSRNLTLGVGYGM